jgi:hypothetical protein
MRQLYALLSSPFSLSSMYLHFFYSFSFTGTSEVDLASPTKWLPPAVYDPRLLSDYSGTVFDHSRVKLVQRNITDCTGTLIAPWAEYDNLRTGTVVLIRVSLKIYNIQNASKTRKVSSLYFIHFSISAHSV